MFDAFYRICRWFLIWFTGVICLLFLGVGLIYAAMYWKMKDIVWVLDTTPIKIDRIGKLYDKVVTIPSVPANDFCVRLNTYKLTPLNIPFSQTRPMNDAEMVLFDEHFKDWPELRFRITQEHDATTVFEKNANRQNIFMTSHARLLPGSYRLEVISEKPAPAISSHRAELSLHSAPCSVKGG